MGGVNRLHYQGHWCTSAFGYVCWCVRAESGGGGGNMGYTIIVTGAPCICESLCVLVCACGGWGRGRIWATLPVAITSPPLPSRVSVRDCVFVRREGGNMTCPCVRER